MVIGVGIGQGRRVVPIWGRINVIDADGDGSKARGTHERSVRETAMWAGEGESQRGRDPEVRSQAS